MVTCPRWRVNTVFVCQLAEQYCQQALLQTVRVTAAPPSEDEVLGAMSIIFWAMTLIVLVKYQLIVVSADDHGEGKYNWLPAPLPCF